MKEKISKKIYTTSITVMMLSIVLLPFVMHVAPFNLSLAWSEQGPGSSLVLLQSDARVGLGSKVAGRTSTVGEVQIYTVRDAFRKEGSFYYEVTQTQNAKESVAVAAGKYNHQALVSIPLLGAWVKTLMHPLGVLLLIGMPFIMFVLSMSVPILRRVLPVVTALERKTMQVKSTSLLKRKKSKTSHVQNPEEVSSESEVEAIESEYITVLKPFNRHNYSV